MLTGKTHCWNRRELAGLGPEYFSVTYGAGGTTREGTKQTVTDLVSQGWNAVPHLSVGGNDNRTPDLVAYYKELGVEKILCLRGDQADADVQNPLYAEDLVRPIRKIRCHFSIVVVTQRFTQTRLQLRQT